MRKLIVTLLVTALAAISAIGPASAATNRAGDSLVNVQVGDITILVPVAVAANLCDINVNVLADQVDAGDTTCDATAESVATPGDGSEGSRNIGGDSLVNVQIGDITALIPIAVAANVCDVSVNVLSQQLKTGEATCDAVGTSTAG